MWLALISDGHLYHHCRKDFNFQRTWRLQTYTFCHLSGCLVRAMISLPSCLGLGKNYSFSTSDLYNSLPEHKGWETCGGNLYFLPQFSNRPHPLPFEHKAISLLVCRMKQMSSMWQDLSKECSCLKQLLIPYLSLLHGNCTVLEIMQWLKEGYIYFLTNLLWTLCLDARQTMNCYY